MGYVLTPTRPIPLLTSPLKREGREKQKIGANGVRNLGLQLGKLQPQLLA